MIQNIALLGKKSKSVPKILNCYKKNTGWKNTKYGICVDF